METYKFKPKNMPILSGFEISRIIESIDMDNKKIKIDLSLGRYRAVDAEIKGNFLRFDWRYTEEKIVPIEIDIEALKAYVKKEERVYAILQDGNLVHLADYHDNRYYQLIVAEPRTAPTIEINGIRMHRTKDITPFEDAKRKVKFLKVRRHNKILDICTGLGYTAIWEKRFGGEVVSVEKDIRVLNLAEYNPWSEGLKDVEIILKDATEAIGEFENNSFDRILNDPPRFTVSGELYSLSFFKEIWRILKPGGIYYQYTGFPEEKYRGKSIIKGIGERLRKAGFYITFIREIGGFICKKSRY